MASSPKAVLCRYRYDPLDRLAGATVSGQANALRFYQKNRLATQIQGAVQRTIIQHEDLLLAQQQRIDSAIETTLLATDQQRSVLQLLDNPETRSLTYSPYGHHPADSGITNLLGFNGEHRDPVTGHYFLGNGYRAFNPVLMRFNSPDSLSPFDEGGINAYAYCEGDPVNYADPSGQIPFRIIPPRPWGSSAYMVGVHRARPLYRGNYVEPLNAKLAYVSPKQLVGEPLQKAVAGVSASVVNPSSEIQVFKGVLKQVKTLKSADKKYLKIKPPTTSVEKFASVKENRELKRIQDSEGYNRMPPVETIRKAAIRLHIRRSLQRKAAPGVVKPD